MTANITIDTQKRDEVVSVRVLVVLFATLVSR